MRFFIFFLGIVFGYYGIDILRYNRENKYGKTSFRYIMIQVAIFCILLGITFILYAIFPNGVIL